MIQSTIGMNLGRFALGRFALGHFALVLGVGRFALIS